MTMQVSPRVVGISGVSVGIPNIEWSQPAKGYLVLFETRMYKPNLPNKIHFDVFVGLGVNFLIVFEINNLRVLTNEKPGFLPSYSNWYKVAHVAN